MRLQLRFVATALLLVTLIPFSLFAETEVADKYDGGDGTVDAPYEINNLAQLRRLSETTDDWGKYFMQTAIIDAADTKTWNVGDHDDNATTEDVAMGFSPTGDRDDGHRQKIAFTGSYNGNGYVINNLYINRPYEDYVGLFGYTEGSQIIKHLGVTNANITGRFKTGILGAHTMNTKVENCYTSGRVSGSYHVGGLVGYCAYAKNCYSTASVICDGVYKGSLGIALWGTNGKYHTNCYYLSDNGVDTFRGSYGFARTNEHLGIISGYIGWAIEKDELLVKGAPPILVNEEGVAKWKMNPLETVDLTLTVMSEGVAVANATVECSGTFLTNENGVAIVKVLAQSEVAYKIWASGFALESGTVSIKDGDWNEPITLGKAFEGGDGTEASPYQIKTLKQLRNLSKNHWDWDKYFVQTANIDAEDAKTWNVGDHDNDATTEDVAMGFSPIGDEKYGNRQRIGFTGSYNGNGYLIDNLYINRPDGDYVGLFGYVVNDTTIEYLGVTNATITGGDRVGILGGNTFNKIENCYTSGQVSGNNYVGGLVGCCKYSENCYSTASVICHSENKGSLGEVVFSGVPLRDHTSCYYLSDNGVDASKNSYGFARTKSELGVISQYLGWAIGEDETLEKGAAPILVNEEGFAKWKMNSYVTVDLTLTVMSEGLAVENATVECNGIFLTNEKGVAIVKVLSQSEVEYRIYASGLTLSSGTVSVKNESLSKTISLDKLFGGGDGSEGNPYQISTLEQLRNLSESHWDWNKYFIQTANVDAEETKTWNVGDADNNPASVDVALGFSPIGDAPKGNRQRIVFTGNYNGNGYVIDNLYINRPKENFVALFGYGSLDTQIIRHLGVTNADITGKDGTGILGAYTMNIKVEDCYTSGRVSGSYQVGGLVGYCGYAKNCYSTASVICDGDKGSLGIAYWQGNGEYHTNCYYLSDNGVDAHKNSYGLARTKSELGVISQYIGWAIKVDGSLEKGALPILVNEGGHAKWKMNPYETLDLTLTVMSDGLAVENATVECNGTFLTNEKGVVIVKVSAQSEVKYRIYAYGFAIASGTVSVKNENLNTVITLKKAFGGGDGTESNPYQISTLDQLRRLSETTDYWDKHFIQTVNIDAADTKTWNVGDHDNNAETEGVAMGFSPIGDGDDYPIGDRQQIAFTGNYNGNGYVIDNLYINRPKENYAALFGNASVDTQTIKHLGVTNANITGRVGAGILGGGTSCKIEDCYTSGQVSGNNYVGGLVGYCAYAKKCYSTAIVICNDDIKGSLGIRTYGSNGESHSNCYYLSDNGGDAHKNSYGFALTKAEMISEGSFVNWDFVGETVNGSESIWAISGAENNGYPYLARRRDVVRLVIKAIETEFELGQEYPLTSITGTSHTDLVKRYYRLGGEEEWSPESPTKTGVYDVKVALSTGDTYLADEIILAKAWTISKGQAVITFEALDDKTYGDKPFELSSTSTGDGLVSYVSSNTDVATIDGITVTVVGAGTTDITVLYAETTNYKAADVTKTLTVNKAATVTTQAVSDITATTATAYGNITDLGAPNPTSHGLCWSTSEYPTTDNSKEDRGVASSTGVFTSSMGSLSSNTTYYVRAFVVNSAGTVYGEQKSFSTLVANSYKPVITANQSFDVEENATNNVRVGTVLATDIDIVTTLSRWTITAGNDDGIFTINANTGDITIGDNSKLDFETTSVYTLSLTVSDGENVSLQNNILVYVLNVNERPVAVAGDNQMADDNATVELNALSSYDPDGDKLDFIWSAPEGIVLSHIQSPKPSFVAPSVTSSKDFIFKLIVSDGQLDSEESFVTVTIDHVTGIHDFDAKDVTVRLYPNPSNGSFYVELNRRSVNAVKVSLFNLTGKLVHSQLLYEKKSFFNLSLQTGLYILKVELDDKTVMKKIIIH